MNDSRKRRDCVVQYFFCYLFSVVDEDVNTILIRFLRRLRKKNLIQTLLHASQTKLA